MHRIGSLAALRAGTPLSADIAGARVAVLAGKGSVSPNFILR